MKIKDSIFLIMMFLCGLWIAYLTFSKNENSQNQVQDFPKGKNAIQVNASVFSKKEKMPERVNLSKSAIKLAGIETQKVFVNDLLEKSTHVTGKVVLDESKVKNQIAHSFSSTNP